MGELKNIGNAGENAAAAYLEKKGYEIIERNFHTKAGEIDIIAISPENTCVFVEVKTRKNILYGRASEAVNRKKQIKIIKTAMSYHYSGSARFDVIEIYYSDKNVFSIKEINHIENAFCL